MLKLYHSNQGLKGSKPICSAGVTWIIELKCLRFKKKIYAQTHRKQGLKGSRPNCSLAWWNSGSRPICNAGLICVIIAIIFEVQEGYVKTISLEARVKGFQT